MLTVPAATPVTTPAADTVASATFDEDQVAAAVTSCVVPFDIVATAENCDDAPTAGTVPVTAIEAIVEGDVEESPHASANMASEAETAIETKRIFIASSSSVVD